MGLLYKDRSSSIKTLNESLKELLPHLQTLRESYSEFIKSEKERIQNDITNLKTLLDVEFSDNLEEESAAIEVLKLAFAQDADIIEEDTNDD